MINSIANTNAASEAAKTVGFANPKALLPQEIQVNAPKDTVVFGGGEKMNKDQAMSVVLERAYSKLQSIVGEARAALGIPEGAVIDTSPEATAQRIADFGLNFFEKYAQQHGLANDEAGRKQFADFIGGAINQGIDEARNILGALQVLDENVGADIDKTASIIQDRLTDFIKNGLIGKSS